MRNRILLHVFLFFLTVPGFIKPQTDRETRAVWVSTNFRLDWPPATLDTIKQQEALEAIFDNLKSKNINTVFFQVRSNGTVLFRSSFDPFSPYITGQVNDTTCYDPLQLAIELAHKKGLELHAWVNVVRCFSGNEIRILKDSNHISQRRPDWIVEFNEEGAKSFWIDPGLPEAREYLSGLIEEMVERYDVDGVHLDFIRYPGKNFDDEFSYSAYGNGIPIDEWRRDNITRLVELIHRKVKSKKPFVKIGAAPIGIYKNLPGMNGWESFNDIYQDTHEWLRRGLLDYAAPQIYWSLNDKTRFDLLAKDWIEKSYGRNIILGIAAYKEDVKEQIENMIHLSRQLNAAGVAFFRYSSIKEYSFGSFNHKTFPALMPWLDGFAPAPPGELIASTLAGKNRFRLEWKTDETGRIDSTRYFAIYSLPSPVDEPQPDYLFDIVPADKNYVTIGFDKPKKINYYFALKSVSKLWKESEEASNVAVVKIPELASLASFFNYKMNPALVNNGRALLISSQIEDRVFISGIERSGGAPVPIAEALLKPGKNIIELFIPLEKYRSLSLLFDSSSRKMNLNLP